MSEYVLEVKNIFKRFPGVLALNDVSFDVRKGEIHGLIGENGAGKSTLLKVINGVYAFGSYQGEVILNGKTARFKSPHNALVEGIGFVPQEINVMNDLTVAENIYVGHLNEGTSRKSVKHSEMVERAAQFLEDNKINLNARTLVGTMSVGQKQLLMVAKALSWNPALIIFDEPTTALAQSDVENLFQVIQHLKEEGKSIVFVTHKLEEIFRITDRVTILRDGCVIITTQRKDYDRKQIIWGMVGRELTQLYPSREPKIGGVVLSVENLTVPHPRLMGKTLVEGVTFHLRKGELLGIVGLVGAGRTETVTALFGGYPSYSGKILIEGKEATIRDEADAIRLGMNILTEDRKEHGLLLLNDIKFNIVISNLKKILGKLFTSKRKEADCAETYMKKLRIKADSASTMAVNLSGGNQQKVVLAKALHSSPKILLLDEPTKGIDVGSKQEIYEIINELLTDGISIIMISSELPEMLGMCDRFIVMANGRVVSEVDKRDATQETLMAACFV